MRYVLLVLVAVCLSELSLSAQVLYGSLTGNVLDKTGAVVPSSRIEATNISTGLLKTTRADDRGAFVFSDLQPGPYRVKISAPSFQSAILDNVQVDANNTRRVDARLEVATVAESVTIDASTVTLQTDRADVNNILSSAQIAELPVGAGRNFQQLYKILPGFSPPTELHSDAGNPQRALGTNVNGVSYSNNNTRLDGATVSYPWLPHIVAYVPPAEAIQTVNVVSNSFDAEQGMAGGSAINVGIKSGTNEFHGSGHWFHTNSVLKSRNYFFVGTALPKNILNQWGGTFGGPIKKNKLFFFTDFERTTRRQYAAAFRTLPTAELRAGNFAETGVSIFDPATGNKDGSGRQLFPNLQIPSSRFDPASIKMIALTPNPNVTGPINNNYFASGVYEFNRDNWDIKVNYNPNEKSSVFARYSLSPSLIFDPPSLGAAGGDALNGGQPGNAPGRVQSAAMGGTYTISPRMILDGNIGFTRQRLGGQNIDINKNYGLLDLNIPGTNGADFLQGGYPRFAISGFSSLGNPNVSNPFLFRDNQYVVASNLSYIRGPHNLRFGGEYSYYTINHFQPQAAYGPRGGFTFSGGLTALKGGTSPNLYNGWGDWLLGLPQAMGKDLQFLNPATVRMPGYGFYARDQWQVNRKLTVTYGLRFERYPFATRDHHGADRYDPGLDKVLIGGLGGVPKDTGVDVGIGQVAPRFGFAYRATEKTVIRAGYGISIDPNSFRNLRDAYPATISLQISGATALEAAGTLRTGLPVIPTPDINQGIISLPGNIGTQTFPKVFNRGYIQSFNFTLQHELRNGWSVQAAYVGSRAIRQTANVNINAGVLGGGNSGRALFAATGRIANINSLTPFNSANYNALQTQATKRFGGHSNLGMTYTWSKAISYADNSDSGLTWNWAQLWDRNRATAGFDRTHNLQIYGTWELPFGKGQKHLTSGPLSYVAGGWQINALASSYTGTPFTVGSAGTSVDSPGNAQTADQIVSTVNYLRGAGRLESWFDPNAFAPVTAVRFGNTGRNILRGPGLFNMDASVFRDFRLTEKIKMQFRAECFNVSNTPAFNNPGATASALTRNTDGSIRALNGFSEITGAQATERQFRMALKLFF